MSRNRLPALLFRQTLVLALIAGACSVRGHAIGVALLAMLAFVPEREQKEAFLARMLKLLVAFLLGLAATWLSVPEVPDKPSWAAMPRQAVLVEGMAESVTGLPGGRVRVLLGELSQADVPADMEAPRVEQIRKAMEPPRFASPESGRKSYAGGLFHDEEARLPGLATLTLDAGILASFSGKPTSW